jgi:invasion protein IalB
MVAQAFSRPRLSSFVLSTMCLIALISGRSGPSYGQQPSPDAGPQASDTPIAQEFAPRGQRMARTISYSDWGKSCFTTPGTKMVCRTSISGTFETGQSAVRVDLIEREGDKATRLQMFLPVGLYLQAGVKITVDQGTAYRIPYIWCLTNTCIASDLAAPTLLKELETGNTLLLEVVDSSVLTVSTSLPLSGLAAVRQGPAGKVFEQAVDE